MKKKDFNLIILVIGVMFILQAFLVITLVYAFPEQKFTLYVTVISVIPSISLILVTLLYVKTSHEILEENQLMRERLFFEEIIKKILLPLLEKIEIEINWFKPNLGFRIRDQKCSLDRLNIKDRMFDKHPEVFFKLFNKYYPELSKEIMIYDEKIPELEKIYSDIISKVDTIQFRKKWNRYVNTYQKKAEGKDRFSELKPFSKTIDGFLESIIYGQKSSIVPELFWKNYGGEILLEQEKNKKEFELLDKKIKEITEYLEELRNDVIKKINSEQEKYQILAYDKKV